MQTERRLGLEHVEAVGMGRRAKGVEAQGLDIFVVGFSGQTVWCVGGREIGYSYVILRNIFSCVCVEQDHR